MALRLPEIQRTYSLWRFPIYVLLAVFLSFFQYIFGAAIAIGDITPDILVILVIWISFAESRAVATFMGFVIGLIFDIITNDTMGTNALAKTIAAFFAGTVLLYSTKEGRVYTKLKFFIVVLFGTFIHNLVYYFFSLNPSTMNFVDFIVEKGVYFTIYTTVFAVLALLFRPPRNVES